jgi:ABC-type multidrug transport system permease subunit
MIGLRKLILVELKLLIRNPSWLFTIGIPLFSLLIFGLPIRDNDPNAELTGLAATSITISLALVGLYVVPVTLVTYRDKGILRRFSTTPVSPISLLIVQLILHVGLIAVSTLILLTVSTIVLNVAFPQHVIPFITVFFLGASAMMGAGLVIAAVAPNAPAANGIGVLLFFPMAFLAGLMVPPDLMSPTLLQLGSYTPLGGFRLAFENAWMGGVSELLPLLVMIGFTFAACLTAGKLFRWT